MPNFENPTPVPRKDLHVFFVLDTSGSMSGLPIATLNSAMDECKDALQEVADQNADANIKIAVLEFNTDCRWVTPHGPEDLNDFVWEELDTGTLTNIGNALDELNSKLSRHEFLNSMTGAFMPVLIFMTDGAPTDDYEHALAHIRQNKWFQKATKIGFSIGANDEGEKTIASIVGNNEAVIKTTDLALFRTLIRMVSVTASTLASTSHTAETSPSGSSIVRQVVDQIGQSDDIISHTDDYDKEEPMYDTSDDLGDWD